MSVLQPSSSEKFRIVNRNNQVFDGGKTVLEIIADFNSAGVDCDSIACHAYDNSNGFGGFLPLKVGTKDAYYIGDENAGESLGTNTILFQATENVWNGHFYRYQADWTLADFGAVPLSKRTINNIEYWYDYDGNVITPPMIYIGGNVGILYINNSPDIPTSLGGGAGSGYIGNSLVSNKKMVGYNVPTSSAEGTKTESVNDVSASAVSGKPKSGNGFARIKFLESIGWYGFIEHMNESQADNRFEYIGVNSNYSRISPNYDSHEIDFGDWANFPLFAKNKPYMVKANGEADYELLSSNYSKKVDGTTDSDVSNTSYSGAGAFAWFPKIYQKQEIVGNDRIVKFSFTKETGFEAVGFKSRENGVVEELEGVWIPMFYGSIQNSKLMSINNSGKPAYGITIGAFKTAIDAMGTRARFFGGAIRNVIADLLTMFARDADIQTYYGYGCMNTSSSSWYPETTIPQNAVKGGGRFYTSHTGTELCKVFHSILNSQVLWQYDPYYKIVNGNFWVSPYYEYGVGNESNIVAPSATGYRRAKKYGLIDDYGQVPAECEDTSVYDVQPYYLYIANSGSDRYSARGGNYSTGRRGFQTVTFDSNYSYTVWDRNASPMMLPPVGYKPE